MRRAWDEVYGQGRPDSVEESVLDDVIAHEPDGDVRGIEEFKRYPAAYLAAFPDTSATIEDVIAEGDKVVSRYMVRGTHTGTAEEYGRPTGQQIVMEGITLYRFSAGKLAEMWDRYDNLAVMQQLGLMSKAEPPIRASVRDGDSLSAGDLSRTYSSAAVTAYPMRSGLSSPLPNSPSHQSRNSEESTTGGAAGDRPTWSTSSCASMSAMSPALEPSCSFRVVGPTKQWYSPAGHGSPSP